MRTIYYYPAPILKSSDCASEIRPRKMLEAFRSLGYDVDVVCGYSHERKRLIECIKNNIRNGIKYDFAYGENTTRPYAMNDPKHYPIHPVMDYVFWAFMKRHNIPFGCFYRDMYWRFPEFRKNVAFHKWAAPLPFHNIDIRMLKKYCTKIFFPTAECAKDLPITFNDGQVDSLPPGGDEIETRKTIFDKEGQINLFYVGGFLPPSYDLAPAIDFVAHTQHPIHFTVCCREDEFLLAKERNLYPGIDSPKIEIIHKRGNELTEYWKQTDIFFVTWGTTRYLKNAMPFKIFEAISNAVPIITTGNNASADLITRENFGWAVEPTRDALENLFAEIIKNPKQIEEKKKSLLEKLHEHTWEARAKYVAESLKMEK